MLVEFWSFPASAIPTLAHDFGPLTRTVRDATLLLDVTVSFDSRDPYKYR
jgi:Asp-tRNA(Asn)/Glu-tRNA(Gln) amidotransferase A subunit family amidase